jgi:hypothetical protein
VSRGVLEEVRQVKQVMGRLMARVQRLRAELDDVLSDGGRAWAARGSWWCHVAGCCRALLGWKLEGQLELKVDEACVTTRIDQIKSHPNCAVSGPCGGPLLLPTLQMPIWPTCVSAQR